MQYMKRQKMAGGGNLKRDLLVNCLSRRDEVEALIDISTPRYLMYGDTLHWLSLYKELSRFQIVLLDENDVLVGCGITVPVCWSGVLQDLPVNIEEVIVNGLDNLNSGNANTLVPIGAYVEPACRGRGLSETVLEAMKSLARDLAMQRLVIPVRPTWKHKHPMQSISEYVSRQNEAGEIFDPWLRVHLRMGAKILKTVESTITVIGRIEDWEILLGMEFPESGRYIIPEGMYPLEIDLDARQGIYRDPNVWVEHPL